MHLTPRTRDELREQIEADTALLLGHNIMDYSLLLGIHDSETRRRSDQHSRSKSASKSSVNPLMAAHDADGSAAARSSTADAHGGDTAGPAYLTPTRWMNCYGGMRVPELEGGEAGEEELTMARVDEELGDAKVYYVAIIDTLQTYNAIKKMERFAKTLKIKTLAGITRKQANTDISSMDAITVRLFFRVLLSPPSPTHTLSLAPFLTLFFPIARPSRAHPSPLYLLSFSLSFFLSLSRHNNNERVQYRMRFLGFVSDSVAPDPLTIRLVDAEQWAFYKAVLAHESEVRRIMEERGLIDGPGGAGGGRGRKSSSQQEPPLKTLMPPSLAPPPSFEPPPFDAAPVERQAAPAPAPLQSRASFVGIANPNTTVHLL